MYILNEVEIEALTFSLANRTPRSNGHVSVAVQMHADSLVRMDRLVVTGGWGSPTFSGSLRPSDSVCTSQALRGPSAESGLRGRAARGCAHNVRTRPMGGREGARLEVGVQGGQPAPPEASVPGLRTQLPFPLRPHVVFPRGPQVPVVCVS